MTSALPLEMAEHLLRAGQLAAAAPLLRGMLDRTAGEEVQPCSNDAPGHDLDCGAAR